MPYSESDPNRRNLVLTSVIISLYYLAGGYLVNGIIKFPLIDIQFQRPWVLEVFVWLMLYWFVFMFWRTRTARLYDNFRQEIIQSREDIFFTWCISIVSGREHEDFKSLIVRNLIHKGRYDWSVEYALYRKHPNSTTPDTLIESIETHELNNTKGRLLIFYLACKCCFTGSAVSTHFVPYLLFYGANLIAAYSCHDKIVEWLSL